MRDDVHRRRTHFPSAVLATPFLLLVLLLLPTGRATAAVAAELEPRVPAGSPELYRLAPETPVVRIVVKFHEGTRVRLRDGSLTTVGRNARERQQLAARKLAADAVAADAAAVEALLGTDRAITGFGRLIHRAEALLDADRAEGERLSGRELADLNLYYEGRVPTGTRFGEVEGLLDRLNRIDSVEIAYAEAPAAPAGSVQTLAPAGALTPNFQSLQGYLKAAPGGVDALYAWTRPGGRGGGVKIVDMEEGWNLSHEDLPILFFQAGQQNPSQSWVRHGTAVLGVLAARNNGIGVTGIAHSAQVGTSSSFGRSTASAIADASAGAGSGGVVLIEIHRPGPPNGSPCNCAGWTGVCDFVPLEYTQADYDMIANAVAVNRTVVETAGNGTSDLNDPAYKERFFRTFRDSGAILVAARNSANGFATCFTNHGYRIDVNSWGENVVTAANGDLYNGGTPSPNDDYTQIFSGTSSAGAIVAGTAASLQGVAKGMGKTLSPAELRARLSSNATWEYFNIKRIGPQPNLRGAIGQLVNGNRLPVANTDFRSTPRNTPLSIGFWQLTGNDFDPDGEAISVEWYDFETPKGGSTDCCHGGGFNYTPPAGFTGVDSLTYRIRDARGLEAIGHVFITVF